MNYRYRLKLLRIWPLLVFASAAFGVTVLIHDYDVGRDDFEKWDQNLVILVASQSAIWIVLAWGLCFGYFKIRFVVLLVWAASVLIELSKSISMHDVTRFSMSILLGGVYFFAHYWIDSLLELSSVNPSTQWFFGKLETIPKVKVTVLNAGLDFEQNAKLRAVDETGAFILFDTTTLKPTELKQLKVRFQYQSNEVEVAGKVISSLDWEERGLGLQFCFEDLYHQSKYTTFVQQLKGEGLA